MVMGHSVFVYIYIIYTYLYILVYTSIYYTCVMRKIVLRPTDTYAPSTIFIILSDNKLFKFHYVIVHFMTNIMR